MDLNVNMRLIVDVILVLVLLSKVWEGRKIGPINTLITIVVLVLALIGGRVAAGYVDNQFSGMIEPFANGLLDTNQKAALEDLGPEYAGYSLEDVLVLNPDIKYQYCVYAFEECGIYEGTAKVMAEEAVELAQTENISISKACDTVLSLEVVRIVAVFVGMCIIAMILSTIVSLANLSYHFPNQKIEKIAGFIMGFVKGILVCVIVCWVFSYFGMILGKETLYESFLSRFFLSMGFLTSGLI